MSSQSRRIRLAASQTELDIRIRHMARQYDRARWSVLIPMLVELAIAKKGNTDGQ